MVKSIVEKREICVFEFRCEKGRIREIRKRTMEREEKDSDIQKGGEYEIDCTSQ
jgi:hypothetical protein